MAEDRLIKVEYIDPALKCYGHYGYYGRSHAELGERLGKWRIVEDPIVQKQVWPALPEFQNYEFRKKAGVRKRRIAWIQDYVVVGGAELTCAECVRVGRLCGFDIALITSRTQKNVAKDVLRNTDLIVVNNFFAFSEEVAGEILDAVYSSRIPYVKFEHDHRELRRPEFSKKLFRDSALNIFLSPMHLENHRSQLFCDGACYPLAIDPDLFLNCESVERKKNFALIVKDDLIRSNPSSSTFSFIENHPNMHFVILTDRPHHFSWIDLPNVTLHPRIPYSDMPRWYRLFEYVVHLLDEFGAGERVVFESTLSGCTLIANDRVGHLSWKFDLSDTKELSEILRQAPFNFWKRIDRLI